MKTQQMNSTTKALGAPYLAAREDVNSRRSCHKAFSLSKFQTVPICYLINLKIPHMFTHLCPDSRSESFRTLYLKQDLTFHCVRSCYTDDSGSPFIVVGNQYMGVINLRDAAPMRSGEDQSQAHADVSPWRGREKRQQYLSHLWLFPFFFFGRGTMLSLWWGFISLRPQLRMVAVLWWPLHKSVLVLSLGSGAGWELDKRRTRRERGAMGSGEVTNTDRGVSSKKW